LKKQLFRADYLETTPPSGWACLIWRLSNEVRGLETLNRHSLRLLNAQIAVVEGTFITKVAEQLAKAFPNISLSSWGNVGNKGKSSWLGRLRRLVAGK
jgi:hypothetical protein